MAHDYEAGHLVQLSWEPDPVGAAGTLEVVGNITGGDLTRGSTKETTEVTVRGETVDSYFHSPIRKRSRWAFTITLIGGDVQQLALQAAYDAGTTHAWMQRGLDPDGDPSAQYEVVSGAILSYQITSPYGAAPVRAELEVQPSGVGIINGTSYGSAG